MSEPLVPPQPSYEELLAVNAQLRADLIQALSEIGELKARLGMTLKNSSKPPSSDGLTKPAPKSLRGKAKRGPGRPKGQVGFTLSPVDDPDHEQTYEPSACCGCGADLDCASVVGNGTPAGVRSIPTSTGGHRAPVDLPRLLMRNDHQGAGAGRGERAGAVRITVGRGRVYLFHGQFLSKSPTYQALSDLFGAKIAASTLVSWVKRITAQITSKVIPGIVDRIAGSAVAHVDETGFRAAGSLQWMHWGLSGCLVPGCAGLSWRPQISPMTEF